MIPEIVEKIIKQALIEGREVLMEHESKAILEQFGFETTGAYFASNVSECIKVANKIGYPIVLKVLSKEIIHKSDVGGVKLNLLNEESVKLAYQELESTFRNKGMIGVSVQRMAKPGIEAIIGITEDETFGKIIMFGLGGVFAEVLRDVSFRAIPISEEDADAMIKEIKGYQVLKGYRGLSVDIEMLKSLLVKVSSFALEMPFIKEMDLNPVFLYPWGYLIADARIVLYKEFLESHVNEKEENNQNRSAQSLRELLYPKSVAVVGASNVKGKLGYNVVWNLINNNFKGKVYPINPNAKEIQGIKAYPSIKDIQENIDVAILLVPAEITPKIISECCAAGVKYVIVESAGYAEKGDEGKRLENEIRDIIRRWGWKTRVIGPNCAGIVNTQIGFVGTFEQIILSEKQHIKGGKIGLIAQAGVYAAELFKYVKEILSFGIIATIGNKIDIDEVDLLYYLGQDDSIEVICLYLENIKRGKEFIKVAKSVSKRKPIIVLKSGRTEEGAKAALSHTASLAGNDIIYDAIFRQTGVIRARNNEQMFALANAFSKQPLPKTNEVFVITYAGSLGVATADALSLNGMRLARFSADLAKNLKEVAPKYTSGVNPLDLGPDQNPENVKKAIEIALQSENLGGIIAIIREGYELSYIDALTNIDYKGKPILVVTISKEFVINKVIELEKAGIPVYSTPELAAEVMAIMHRYYLYKHKSIVKTSY